MFHFETAKYGSLTDLVNNREIQSPNYICAMSTGMVYVHVSEHVGNIIRVLKDGKEISNYSKAGLHQPMGMYICEAETILYVKVAQVTYM